MKTCPVCGSALFDDMPTCYGCLYQFGSDLALESQRAGERARRAEGPEGTGRWAALIDGDGAAIPLVSPAAPGCGGCGCKGGESHGAVREMALPGWVVRVRAEGPGASDTSLTIEIEPAYNQAGSERTDETEPAL